MIAELTVFFSLLAIAGAIAMAVFVRIELNEKSRRIREINKEMDVLRRRMDALLHMSSETQDSLRQLAPSFDSQRAAVTDQDMRIQKLEMFVENVKDNAKKIREQQEEHKRQIQSRFAR